MFPKVGPLTAPASNQGGRDDVKAIYRLHLEIDGTGFNTLAAALELAREAMDGDGFEEAQENLQLSGEALFEKYKGGHCTALAEVLRNRVQEETGITGRILTVLYADSKFPLDYEWKYDGTVHTDVLFPFFENGRFRAVHVVNGMGTDGHFHEFDSQEKLLEHLKDLRYLLAEVADPMELTAKAFGCKNKLWIKRSKEDRFCVDVVKGITFIANGEEKPLQPEPGSIEFWKRVARHYNQPDDFVENLTYLAEHLDEYRELLCEPGRSLR